MQSHVLFRALLCLVASASAFITPRRTTFVIPSPVTTTARFLLENDDFPDNTDYKGEVDWDAEWKKVVTSKDSKPRPGSNFYKTDAEIALTKTVNKAAEKVAEARASIDMPDMNWNSIKGDWKFWLAILAMLSVGISVLNGYAMTQSYSPDSYYV